MDVGDLTLREFSDRIGEIFSMRLEDGGTLDFELTEAEPARTLQSSADDSFSVLFLGPVEPTLDQSIVRFHHETMGAVEIFVVPIHRDETGTTYEAVFNRSS